MGKGDRRSKRGKIFRGTFGKRRPKPEKIRKKIKEAAAAASTRRERADGGTAGIRAPGGGSELRIGGPDRPVAAGAGLRLESASASGGSTFPGRMDAVGEAESKGVLHHGETAALEDGTWRPDPGRVGQGSAGDRSRRRSRRSPRISRPGGWRSGSTGPAGRPRSASSTGRRRRS